MYVVVRPAPLPRSSATGYHRPGYARQSRGSGRLHRCTGRIWPTSRTGRSRSPASRPFCPPVRARRAAPTEASSSSRPGGTTFRCRTSASTPPRRAASSSSSAPLTAWSSWTRCVTPGSMTAATWSATSGRCHPSSPGCRTRCRSDCLPATPRPSQLGPTTGRTATRPNLNACGRRGARASWSCRSGAPGTRSPRSTPTVTATSWPRSRSARNPLGDREAHRGVRRRDSLRRHAHGLASRGRRLHHRWSGCRPGRGRAPPATAPAQARPATARRRQRQGHELRGAPAIRRQRRTPPVLHRARPGTHDHREPHRAARRGTLT